MFPLLRMSLIQIVVFFLTTLSLLIGFGFLSQMYHLGLFGIILSQILAILGPVWLWSKQKRAGLIHSIGLSPWDFRAAIVGICFGIFWFFFLLLWISPWLEQIFPLSKEEQAATLRLLHPQSGFRPLLVDLLGLAWIPAFCEEIFFRGFLLPALLSVPLILSLSKRYRFGVALLVSSILFGLFHLSLAKFLPTFFLGCGFCFAVIVARSLWAGIFMHAANNTLVLLLLRLQIEHNNLSFVQKMFLTAVGILFAGCGILVVNLNSLYKDSNNDLA